MMVTPMFFMALPLVRHLLKGNPYRDRIFLGLIGLGLVHGTYLIMSAGETSDGEEEVAYVTPAQLARSRTDRNMQVGNSSGAGQAAKSDSGSKGSQLS